MQAFESRLAALIRGGSNIVAIECSGLRQVTSSHISLLWNAQSECESAGVRLQLDVPPPILRRVLQALDLEGAFLYDSASERTNPDVALAPSPARQATASDRTDPYVIVAPSPSPQATVYSDAFAPTSEGIDAGITRFLQFLSQSNVPEITTFELRIVIYEITTNIMCHSALSPLDRIEMRAQAGTSEVTLEFSDPGPAFDPTAQEFCADYRQAAKDRQTRGFGLAMVRSLVDAMEYARRDATSNVLTLKKRWSAEK